MDSLKLPVGIEFFDEIRTEGFYYVDKTRYISDLLRNWGKVNLFTRPRRFGKTLTMSMLKSFFEIGGNRALFDGLAISEEVALCDEYMGKFPVVFITLKDVEALSYNHAYGRICSIIRDKAIHILHLLEHADISTSDRDFLDRIIDDRASEAEIQDSLKTFSRLLATHYGQKVIILIDEYDVPLAKAFNYGYYDEMVSLIRVLFSNAFKTNENLHFAVLTGCLRVSKESIFTGLNNLKVFSIADAQFDEHFGFTDDEVREMLAHYGAEDQFATTKEWYDGYRFGDADIYCPWDVINHVDKLRFNKKSEPQSYWINTSGNDLVKRFIDKADKTTQSEIERLIAGEPIEKAIRLELTYDELDTTIDNLWSVLFTTGYLTQCGKSAEGKYKLVIPNREIREIFVLQIQEWFKETVSKDRGQLRSFCSALQNGDAPTAEEALGGFLMKTISVLGADAREGPKESFYHGMLLGLLRSEENWLILSNTESGEGYSDILVETDDLKTGFVIEVKYAGSLVGLDRACTEALDQISSRRYDARLRDDGYTRIFAYGIAFYKKRCKVVAQAL